MPKRGSIASCACAPCRKRKTRCDGSRPTCKACEQRKVECKYDVEEGLTRTAALKSKLEQLELDYGSIVELHAQLKNGQPDEVAALVNRIRSEDPSESRAPLEASSIIGDGYADVLETSEDMASETNWESYNTPSTGYGEMPRNTVPPNPFFAGMSDEIPIDPALAGLDPQINQYTQANPAGFMQDTWMPARLDQGHNLNVYGLPMADPRSNVSARQLFQTQTPSMLRSNLPILRQGMALHGSSIPEACSVYSDLQVEGLISDVEMQADHEIPKARLCELSSIAAVAAQYVRGHLQPGVIEFFYDAAKHFFEDCMLSPSPSPNPVPLKVCAMLALANILTKSFLAFVYIDLGLSLAQNIDDFTTLPIAQHSDLMEAKRIRITMLSIRGYAHEYVGMGG